MNPIPLIRVNTFLPFVDFLESLGSPIESLLEQTKLSIFALNDSEALIPRHLAFNFLEKAARREGIENLGVLVGQQTSLGELGIFGRMICQSLTLYDGLNICIRIISSNNSGEKFWLTQEGEKAWFCHQYINFLKANYHHAVYYALILIVELIQMAAGKRWHPKEIKLQICHKNVLTKSQLFANSKIQTQEFTAVAFPRSFLSLPLNSALNFCDGEGQENEKNWRSSAPAENFSGSLRQAITTMLRGSYPDISLASEITGMSIRTLQRRLAEEGLTYSRLVEQTRFDMAIKLLQDPHLKLLDISTELGYTDPAHFTRAFKRWTRISPLKYRRQEREKSI